MLEELLTPKKIAVIGVSRTPGKVGHEIVANLQRGGFKGTIVPITPSAKEILGLRCHASLQKSRHKVDLSIIAIPAQAVADAVNDSINAGAKAIIVVSAGFKEVGTEGARLEDEVAELCRANNVRLLGPNCIGVQNSHHGMNATFAPMMPPKGAISVISQSGALCVAILDWAAGKKLGFGNVVSLGNKADLDEGDFLKAFASDKNTKVIVAYLESIKDGKEFLEVAEQTAAVKPLVVLKSGVTQAGAKAASSHTGSLAGSDAAYNVAFRRSGVIRADHLTQLFEYAQAFATQPLPGGHRLTILTNAGGAGILAADKAESLGLKIGEPSEPTKKKLKQILPASASFTNPVDVIGDADPDRFTRAFKAVQEDANTDGVLILVTPQNMTAPLQLAEKLAKAHRGVKPLLTSFIGGQEIAKAVEFLADAQIPNYDSPEAAAATFKAMADYAAWRDRPSRRIVRFPVNHHRVDRVLNRQRKLAVQQVAEAEAKEILRAYGFKTLPGGLAADADEAVEMAKRIGFPVVMKIVSPGIVHKSDFGGVILNLADEDHVRDAFDIITARIRRRASDAVFRGVYVERMGRRGREVILGMSRDVQFGPMLMFGLGGIFVEVMKDVSFSLSPITPDEAMQMLEGTKSYSLLKGVRGQRPVDLTSIIDAIQRLSQLASDYPQITELDINPFIVTETPTGSYVADARMTLALDSHESE